MAARGHRARSYAYENKYRKNLATGYAGISGAVLSTNTLPKYTTTGTSGLKDSTITDDGADVTIAATTGAVINGVVKFKAGGANLGTITHVAAVPRTWTFPDASGTVVVSAGGAGDFQLRSEKNAANGYAGLDGGSRIAKAQAPAATVYTDVNNTFTSGQHDFTAAADLRVPVNSSPGFLAVGDVWIDVANLKYRDNAATPATQTVERQSLKNAANGYAGLGAAGALTSGKVPRATAGGNLADGTLSDDGTDVTAAGKIKTATVQAPSSTVVLAGASGSAKVTVSETGVGFHGTSPQAKDTGWSLTGGSTLRVLAAGDATVANLFNLLQTLIETVLKGNGLLGA